jgi:hypothetical protein
VRTYTVPTGRRYERRPANTPVTLVVRSNGNESEHQSCVVETSERGLRLRLHTPLTPGQIVLVMSGEESKYSVRGRVVWAHKPVAGQEGEAGLQLLDTFAPQF